MELLFLGHLNSDVYTNEMVCLLWENAKDTSVRINKYQQPGHSSKNLNHYYFGSIRITGTQHYCYFMTHWLN